MAHKPEQVSGRDADLMFQKSLYIRKSLRRIFPKSERSEKLDVIVAAGIE